MAYDAYLDITGIEGEATAKGFENKIEIYSFSFGASNPSTVGPGATGMAAGRVSISSFNVMKKTDKTSAKLFQSCAEGQDFDKMVVSLRKAAGAGGQAVFLKYTFEHVMIDSIQWSGSSGGDDVPTESVSFAFAKVSIEYQQQDTKGNAVGKPQLAAWDLTTVSSK